MTDADANWLIAMATLGAYALWRASSAVKRIAVALEALSELAKRGRQ